MAPLNRRTTISIHRAVAIAVTKKLSARPEKPISITRRRPKRSDRPPRMGELKKLAMQKAIVTESWASVCADSLCVKVPTSGGSTGMIRPMETMSISTAIMMKPMPAVRLGRAACYAVCHCNS